MFKTDQEFRKATSYDGDETHMPVNVIVIASMGEDEDGEERWRIRLPESGKAIIVDEADLSPSPREPETTREKFASLFDGFESPMVMAAAVEGICNYGKEIADNESQVLADMEGGMVHGPSWVAAAKRAAEIIDPK